MFKRFGIFILINILVVTTISITLNLLGIRPYLTANGIDYEMLLGFCLVWGFGGAFISLAMSRIMAKWMMGVEVIDPNTNDSQLRQLVESVHSLSVNAGLSTMPEVGIYQSPEINAFATGPTKSRSLVAVSTGLLQRMNSKQVEGVLAHEVAHIANGDMVTMTLVQGVVNAFVMFVARVIAYAISLNVKEESRRMVNMLTVFVLEILLSILAAMVVSAFSRYREYRADAGGAQLAGREQMIAALQGLQRAYEPSQSDDHASLATLKISGKTSSFMKLFSTHPPLEERIRRLQEAA